MKNISKEKAINKKSDKGIFPYVVLCLTLFIFCFSLFKNISYPLVWNDESEGAMTGKRVVQFGYPKVHDGKNVVFMSLAANIKDEDGNIVGYKKSHDAYIYITWGNYYWAAIGAYLGQFTDDIYMQTALLRLPFAITGLIGLVFFLLPFKNIFSKSKTFLWFCTFFFIIEFFSISLILHMREARYFSLVIFVCGLFHYIYVNHFISSNWSYKKYLISLSLLLFFSYNINFISYAIFSAILSLMLAIHFISSSIKDVKGVKKYFLVALKNSLPIIISFIAIIPLLIFFETFKTSRIISEYSKFTYELYKTNVGMIVNFFSKLEFIYALLIIKAIWLIIWYISRKEKNKNQQKSGSNIISKLEKTSLFSVIFFLLFGIMIARSPYLFVRHYIAMQPIMAIIILTDIFAIYYYFKNKQISAPAVLAIFASIIFVFSANAKNKIPYVKEHYYEITHQYKGVLDFVIPYIKENYPNHKDLVIATDYEEFSYMYYLDSKVTIGYIQNNLEDDLKHQPDIIMYRKSWGGNPQIFNDFMQKARYEKITFPVADYPVNNIPELDFSIKHLFRTKFARNEQEKAEIWVRVKEEASPKKKE